MTHDDQIIEFTCQKRALFALLDKGIIFREDWDRMITDAEMLGMEASRDSLQSYYDHYRMGEMGRENIITHKSFAEHAMSGSRFNGLGRTKSLTFWREVLSTLQAGAFANRKDEFDKYIRPLKIKRYSESSVELIATNSIIADWIATNALTDIDDVVDDILGCKANVMIDVEQEVEA